ncbi:MAG: hypothetical protein AAF466_03280 [Bacteroidota bacterium]
MKHFFFLFLIAILLGCKSDRDNDDAATMIKYPTVVPYGLELKSSSIAMVLNESLFNFYDLKRNEIAEARNGLLPEDFEYETVFVNYVNVSKDEAPPTAGAARRLSIQLNFQCDLCKDAYFFKGKGNDNNIRTEILLALKDPSVQDHLIASDRGFYEFDTGKETVGMQGFIGFYLVLVDEANELFIYEIAGVNGDATPPVFEMAESCDPKSELSPTEGLVCFDAMNFQGNDRDGYAVPLKGQVYGDIGTIVVNDHSIAFAEGNFFARVDLPLVSGYNQIPVEIIDRLGNRTDSFIEIELEEVADDSEE